MMKRNVRLDGRDLFFLAIADRKISSYKILGELYVKSEAFKELCKEQNQELEAELSLGRVIYAVEHYDITEDERAEAKTTLKKTEKFNIGRKKNLSAKDILNALFKHRRAVESKESDTVNSVDATNSTIGVTDSIAATDLTDVTDSMDVTDFADVTDSMDATNPIDVTDPAYATDSTDVTETVDTTDSTDVADSVDITGSTVYKEINLEAIKPDVKSTFLSFNEEVRNLIFEMAQSEAALTNLIKAYQKARLNFLNQKVRQQRTTLMNLIEHTFVVSLEELAILMGVDVKILNSLLNGALKKKANLYFKRHLHVRNRKKTSTKPESVTTIVQAEEKGENLTAEQVTSDNSEDIPKSDGNSGSETSQKTNGKVSSSIYDDKHRSLYRVRDGIYEWFSDIGAAENPSQILLDTNIVMDETLHSMVKDRFSRGWISTVTIFELRKLMNGPKKSIAKVALEDIALCAAEDRFYSPVKDHESAKLGDHDVSLVDVAAKKSLTFVTADSGAKVYAWTIGCPCRYYRTIAPKPSKVTVTNGRMCIIDANIHEKGIVNFIHMSFESVIVTNELAKYLNKRKFELSYGKGAVTDLQIDIATDTIEFYVPYKMENSRNGNLQKYEMELIDICAKTGATLISSDSATIALAWSYGIDTVYYNPYD